MDSDRDGRVTAAEVQTMLERLGINLREDIVFNLVRSASQTGMSLYLLLTLFRLLNVQP